jgi:hypothetical protein
MIERDEERYATLLRLVGSLSRLFSENDSPYVDSRFVERLFVQTTGARDLSRMDISFDAVKDDIGVGVKTFLAGAGSSKREKIAEFTTFARDGRFAGLDKESLVHEVVSARNDRVVSDANEVGIDLSKSLYHCLIRMPGGAVVHEEAYGAIDVSGILPTDSQGNVLKSWSKMGNGIYFTDGISQYSFSVAKNVLMKRFEFDREKGFISIDIKDDPLGDLEQMFATPVTTISPGQRKSNSTGFAFSSTGELDLVFSRHEEEMNPGFDYVILPLYSTRNSDRLVPERSGINQWNAAGRTRQLGEAYVPIPALVHMYCPEFFPMRDATFKLQLPNQSSPVMAKVCQDNSKALMTSPNRHLGTWLIGVLKPNLEKWMFEETPGTMPPLNYSDLEKIGKDSVRVSRVRKGEELVYAIEFAPIGSYEDFLNHFENIN